MKNKSCFIIALCVLHFTALLGVHKGAFAGDAAFVPSQNDSGVLVFSAKEFEASKDEFGEALVKNGFSDSSIKSYVESDSFGFKEFSEEVVRLSANLKRVMVIFHFHGVDDGGCVECSANRHCFQGDLSAKYSFIAAQQIVDDFLVPLEGKEITVFFRSCFSGHFASKVHKLAAGITWEKPTPIALIATDNNDLTFSLNFPYPNYERRTTKFYHWDLSEHASKYQDMLTFEDFVQFINLWNYGFTFMFFSLNGGENIGLAEFGFKDLTIKPLEEIKFKQEIYRNIDHKLKKADPTSTVVLIVERQRTYENLAHGDMWLNALEQNGVAKEKIHWLKPEKKSSDLENNQIHSLDDNFDFIADSANVLVLVRGDDVVDGGSWRMMIDQEQTVSGEQIATIVMPKLTKAKRVMVLLCSPYSDHGFEQLVPMLTEQEHVAVVSLFTPKRDYHRTILMGWPLGFLAPLYKAKFLFYADRKLQNVYPKSDDVRKLAINCLQLFDRLTTFEDYLDFLQKSQHWPVPQNVEIKTHNVAPNDLGDFGFLPKEIPPEWLGW